MNTSRPMVVPSRMANSCTAASLPEARVAQDVLVGALEGGHLLALHGPLDGLDLVAQRGRALVLHQVGGDLHVLAERLRHLLLATFQEEHHLVDVGAVVVLGDGLDAGALAALDVVQEAGARQGPLASLMSMVQVRNGNSRRIRFMASSTLLAEAYGPK